MKRLRLWIPLVMAVAALGSTAGATMFLRPGAKNVTTYFFVTDNAGDPNTDPCIADYDLYYLRAGRPMATKVDMTALTAAHSPHSDNKGFGDGLQGLLRVDWPDAAFTGGPGTTIELLVVDGTGEDVIFPLRVQLSPPVQATAPSEAIYADEAVSATANTITFPASADDIITRDDGCVPCVVKITGDTGAGQSRNGISYDLASRTLTVGSDWITTPDNTSDFEVLISTGSEYAWEGLVTAAGDTWCTLDATASSEPNIYAGSWIKFTSGTGSVATYYIDEYNAVDYNVFHADTWDTNPDTTTVAVIIPAGGVTVGASGAEMDDIQAALTAQGLTTTFAASVGALPATIGTPGDTDFVTDVNNLALLVEAVVATLGTPGDTDFVTDVNNLALLVEAIVLTLGTPGDTDVVTDVNNLALLVEAIVTTLGTPADTDLATDIANLVVDVNVIADVGSLTSGTAQAATGNSITLAAATAVSENTLWGAKIAILTGTGAGQTNYITRYDATTKIARTLLRWVVTPDATSTYAVYPGEGRALEKLLGKR